MQSRRLSNVFPPLPTHTDFRHFQKLRDPFHFQKIPLPGTSPLESQSPTIIGEEGWGKKHATVCATTGQASDSRHPKRRPLRFRASGRVALSRFLFLPLLVLEFPVGVLSSTAPWRKTSRRTGRNSFGLEDCGVRDEYRSSFCGALIHRDSLWETLEKASHIRARGGTSWRSSTQLSSKCSHVAYPISPRHSQPSQT